MAELYRRARRPAGGHGPGIGDMGDDHLAVGELDVRKEALVTAQDAAIGEGWQLQGLIHLEVGKDLIGQRLAGNTRHFCLGRAGAQPIAQLADGPGRTTGQHLHPAIGEVAYIAREAQPLRLLPRRCTKEDPLHPTADQAVEADLMIRA